MPETLEGKLLVGEGRFAIVVSRFNELVTRRLLDGAVDTLHRHGASDANITVAWVPGSFEIPLIADRFAQSSDYSAVICLGAVIQGETDHHEYINHAVSQSLVQISRDAGVPVTFGILTCQTLDQALNRAGGKAGNKGSEAALAAIETASLISRLDDGAAAG